MIGKLYQILPTGGKIAVSSILFVIFTLVWFFVGNVSSTYHEFKIGADETKKREELPETFIPIPLSCTMVGLEEIHSDSPFGGKRKKIIAYFHSGLLESSVQEFYDKELPGSDWKVVEKNKSKDGTVIKLKNDEIEGEIEILHESSGSEIALSISNKE